MAGANFLIVAGEASGDLHGSKLVGELLALDPRARFFGAGGDLMRQAGVETFFDVAEMAVVGLVEAFGKLARLRKMKKHLLEEAAKGKADAAILIDYPGFNLALARALKRLALPVVYYICPQVWAWRIGRLKSIARDVDLALLILPFEEGLYCSAGVRAVFVGHPALDSAKSTMTRQDALRFFGLDSHGPIVGLMPGSRIDEVRRHLPPMLQAAAMIKSEVAGCQFILPVAKSLGRTIFKEALGSFGLDVKLAFDKTYDAMAICDFLIISSGTATIEAAILGIPMAVVYRVNPLTYLAAKAFVRLRNIGLINIVAGAQVAPEFVQRRLRPGAIAKSAVELLRNEGLQARAKTEMMAAASKLGRPGASRRAAAEIIKFLNHE